MRQLEMFLDGLPSMKKDVVTEVACGFGYVTMDLFLTKFNQIQMFDHCPKSIDLVREKFKNFPKVSQIRQSKMESYEWDTEQNCILFRYCAGYLNDK